MLSPEIQKNQLDDILPISSDFNYITQLKNDNLFLALSNSTNSKSFENKFVDKSKLNRSSSSDFLKLSSIDSNYDTKSVLKIETFKSNKNQINDIENGNNDDSCKTALISLSIKSDLNNVADSPTDNADSKTSVVMEMQLDNQTFTSKESTPKNISKSEKEFNSNKFNQNQTFAHVLSQQNNLMQKNDFNQIETLKNSSFIFDENSSLGQVKEESDIYINYPDSTITKSEGECSPNSDLSDIRSQV